MINPIPKAKGGRECKRKQQIETIKVNRKKRKEKKPIIFSCYILNRKNVAFSVWLCVPSRKEYFYQTQKEYEKRGEERKNTKERERDRECEVKRDEISMIFVFGGGMLTVSARTHKRQKDHKIVEWHIYILRPS